MGSVKDLIILEEPKEKSGIGRFVFSDRYSVFDWGEMPDKIESKGKALCIVGSYFFERMEEKGIKTHYMGIVENGEVKRLKDAENATNTMQIKLLRVLKPEIKNGKYDYSVYEKERENFLIPLEIIYRNSLPEGSSIFRRLRDGEITLDDIGLEEMPEPGQKLDKPILDVSTKLEETDRYIKWEEAKKIAELSDDEVEELKRLTMEINELISREAGKAGLENEDGKLEFGFDEDRNIMVVDVAGTPDECRFTYDGFPVSKEIARKFYRNTEWYEMVKKAKKMDRIGWRNKVGRQPPRLPPLLLQHFSFMYQAVCNEITERKWFDVPPLRKVIEKLREMA